jgi:hypothetical protein
MPIWELKPIVQHCRVCGCTDDDCSQCIEKTGVPCHWVEHDLCSACRDESQERPFDLVAHLDRQHTFSERTFGPGERTEGVLKHICEEILEVASNPHDVTEWIDIVILAFDGALRMGFSPWQIANALAAKQAKNEARKWPDWRTAEPGKPIGHIE